MSAAFDFSAIRPIDLSAQDLDRLSALQRQADDRRADDGSLCAYAPDPDADWKAGVAHGVLIGLHAPSPVRWEHRRVGARAEMVKLAIAVAAILAVAAVMVWDAVS